MSPRTLTGGRVGRRSGFRSSTGFASCDELVCLVQLGVLSQHALVEDTARVDDRSRRYGDAGLREDVEPVDVPVELVVLLLVVVCRDLRDERDTVDRDPFARRSELEQTDRVDARPRPRHHVDRLVGVMECPRLDRIASVGRPRGCSHGEWRSKGEAIPLVVERGHSLVQDRGHVALHDVAGFVPADLHEHRSPYLSTYGIPFGAVPPSPTAGDTQTTWPTLSTGAPSTGGPHEAGGL